MKVNVSVLLAILMINFNKTNSLDILGIFPFQGKSHFFVFEPYLRELVKRGHNLTIISFFPQKQCIQNYTDISLADKRKIYEDVVDIDQTIFSQIRIVTMIYDDSMVNCRILLADKTVQHLVRSRAKFDLVLMEAFLSDCALGVAYKLGAPVVALTSHPVIPQHYDRFGIPHQFLQLGPDQDFITRLVSTALIECAVLIRIWFQNKEQKILATYFDDIPHLEELGQDIKLLLVYTHKTMVGPQAFPENVKAVGGYHVAQPKPLPEKLRKFIEQSAHGVIYISFGSMVKAASIPMHKLEAIVSALSELPQRVVWKWEDDHLPGNPKNIYLSKWLPQNDILAHPNVVAFYSHCGLVGTTEAIHHGVPMVAMPIFAEQPYNAMAIVRKGFGIQIRYSELTKDDLLEKFRTVLHPEFRKRAKEISREWHDRPMSAMDSAIYWTEYAARHPNSTLRTAAVGKPHYQLAGWDILFTVLSVIFVFIYAIKFLIFGKRKRKVKKE